MDTKKRTITKALTWRFTGTMTTMLISFILTLVLFISITKTFLEDLPSIDSLEDYTPDLITKIYDINNKIIRAQEISATNIERIKELNKKIKTGYKFIDIKTGRAYKTEKTRYAAQVKIKNKEEKEDEKVEEAEKPKDLKDASLDELLEELEE